MKTVSHKPKKDPLYDQAIRHLHSAAKRGTFLLVEANISVGNYVAIAQDLRRQLLGQLARSPAAPQQGQLFE